RGRRVPPAGRAAPRARARRVAALITERRYSFVVGADGATGQWSSRNERYRHGGSTHVQRPCTATRCTECVITNESSPANAILTATALLRTNVPSPRPTEPSAVPRAR